MVQHFDFLRESIRNLRKTGSVARSSRFLCQAIADKIDPKKGKVVVELGPGDGVITEYILRQLEQDAQLVVFEINDAFFEKLQAAFKDEPRIVLIHDGAENMAAHFNQLGINEVDYFISGIPFVMLPESLAVDIISKCKDWLKSGGAFIQFHYSPLLIPMYKRIFGNTKTEFIPLNIPPALVISCRK
jgi:phosphatidylethanolamine/phosphatidyl-N-methylethanolamine N-methyltransferase